jgi:hypothetical protein
MAKEKGRFCNVTNRNRNIRQGLRSAIEGSVICMRSAIYSQPGQRTATAICLQSWLQHGSTLAQLHFALLIWNGSRCSEHVKSRRQPPSFLYSSFRGALAIDSNQIKDGECCSVRCFAGPHHAFTKQASPWPPFFKSL